MIKNCLKCKKEFEAIRESAKYCSDSCRVMWNRKNDSPQEKAVELKSQVQYRSILEEIKELKNIVSKKGFREIENIGVERLSSEVESMFPVKPKLKRSFQNYKQLKLDCDNDDDWEKLRQEILESGLPQGDINTLLS